LRDRCVYDSSDPFAVVAALRRNIAPNPAHTRDARLRLTLLLLFLLICLIGLRVRRLILNLDLVVLILIRRRRRVIVLRLLLHLPVILRRRSILRANSARCTEKKNCRDDCEKLFHGHLPAIRCREQLSP
jgi:hypothetical protein